MARYKEYPGFLLYPFYHKTGKMPWAAASVIPLNKAGKIIWLSGATGRDPESDRSPINREEEERGVVYKVVGGIKEQTIATWTRIKEILEETGATLEDIVFIRYYLVNKDDWWDMREARNSFFKEHCPNLLENPPAGVLLKGATLDLPTMLIEIEVVAVTGKEGIMHGIWRVLKRIFGRS